MKLKRPDGGRFGNRPATPIAAPVTPVSAPATSIVEPGRRSPVVSPLVRRQAREHGIDASQLAGSGPGSLVLRSDVDVAIAALEAGLVQSHPVEAAASNGDVRIPITGMRKLIGSRLSTSRSTIPEATIWLDVDATELFNAKDRLQKSTGERFSLTALIARFVVAGLAQYPVLNSSLDDAAGEIVQHAAIGLGIAAQTPRGLMVPVVHDAGSLTTRQLRDELADLVTHAEKGDYPAAALNGGTFTLNNYGGFGVDGSTPIINYPEVAMLGVGRIIDRPWVVDGQLAVRKVVTLSFVFDHRVCDGDVASGFITFIARCIEEPLTLLGSV
jgi:pyruvate dehydrogenase E2 component (dihydrolipoamide acetyltransferase)